MNEGMNEFTNGWMCVWISGGRKWWKVDDE
mgnify:FL=1